MRSGDESRQAGQRRTGHPRAVDISAEWISALLEKYPQDCRPRGIETLGGAGGFSGAEFWRLSAARGALCLRHWPIQADPQWPSRLAFIHAVLVQVDRHGAPLVPAPIRTRLGETFLQQDGRLWELTSWLPGRADYFPLRRTEKLRAALAALAEFHLAAAEYRAATGEVYNESADWPAMDRLPAPSPGVRRRRQQIDELRTGGLRALSAAIEARAQPSEGIDGDAWNSLHRLAHRLLPLYAQVEEPVRRQLSAAQRLIIPLQACIRDIWHAHVLFQNDRVSGFVDFGAMRYDSVACDVARLLGSMAHDDAEIWREGLVAYEAIRRLSDDERQLVAVFDRSTTLLAGINWLEWIYVKDRTFADLAVIIERLAEIVARIEWQVVRG